MRAKSTFVHQDNCIVAKKKLAARLRGSRGSESQAKLATRSGVSDGTISLIEQAKILPGPKTIIRLAIATGNDPAEWLSTARIKISSELFEAVYESILKDIKPSQMDPEKLRMKSIYSPTASSTSEVVNGLERIGEALERIHASLVEVCKKIGPSI